MLAQSVLLYIRHSEPMTSYACVRHVTYSQIFKIVASSLPLSYTHYNGLLNQRMLVCPSYDVFVFIF